MVKTYPAVLLMTGHVGRIALSAALIALAQFPGSAVVTGVGLVASSVCWVAQRLAAELGEIVAEALLPR
ncbi:hypothetical protein B2J86_10620 [Acidovorax sp. SRB_14]|uniref:hypothetical protein n=1 Tax=Acidovorax sp. SRB_14 TaxID=1962699 RepID=UPI001564CE0D|nr:hypothetical protein [Acidovorax sp. SRB_14]NMM81368.1 hypothetical protein [Acidovorax sp. SRB_14]